MSKHKLPQNEASTSQNENKGGTRSHDLVPLTVHEQLSRFTRLRSTTSTSGRARIAIPQDTSLPIPPPPLSPYQHPSKRNKLSSGRSHQPSEGWRDVSGPPHNREPTVPYFQFTTANCDTSVTQTHLRQGASGWHPREGAVCQNAQQAFSQGSFSKLRLQLPVDQTLKLLTSTSSKITGNLELAADNPTTFTSISS